MAWLVDTNVFVELRKGERCDTGVRAWYDAARDGDLYTSVLVIGEIRRGVESVRRRDPHQAAALDQWLMRLHGALGERVLGVDASVATRWGRLNVPRPIPAVDGLLAATALEHELTLVTRSTKEVSRTGVDTLDPFRRT
ncbi:MAG: type II toxin-antitoxin system VapC family toxin [Candidatus Limnocylindrales bacterium]